MMLAEEIHDWLRTNLFDEVPIAISVISPDFRIVEANRRFREAYGAWQGRPCYEVYKGRTERCEHCAAVETFADGKITLSMTWIVPLAALISALVTVASFTITPSPDALTRSDWP